MQTLVDNANATGGLLVRCARAAQLQQQLQALQARGAGAPQLQRQGTAGSAGSAGSGGSGFSDAGEVFVLRMRLTCSSCKQRDRSCTLARCHHTFCGECIEERKRSRNRRCPQCNVGFADSDIATILLT